LGVARRQEVLGVREVGDLARPGRQDPRCEGVLLHDDRIQGDVQRLLHLAAIEDQAVAPACVVVITECFVVEPENVPGCDLLLGVRDDPSQV
jgi:hypothetical protein